MRAGSGRERDPVVDALRESGQRTVFSDVPEGMTIRAYQRALRRGPVDRAQRRHRLRIWR